MAPQLTLVSQKCIILDVFTSSTKASEPTNQPTNQYYLSTHHQCSMPHADQLCIYKEKIAVHHPILVYTYKYTIWVRVKSTVQLTKLQTTLSPGPCMLRYAPCDVLHVPTAKRMKKLNRTITQTCPPAWHKCECGVCKIHSTKFDGNKIFHQFKEFTSPCPYEF